MCSQASSTVSVVYAPDSVPVMQWPCEPAPLFSLKLTCDGSICPHAGALQLPSTGAMALLHEAKDMCLCMVVSQTTRAMTHSKCRSSCETRPDWSPEGTSSFGSQQCSHAPPLRAAGPHAYRLLRRCFFWATITWVSHRVG